MTIQPTTPFVQIVTAAPNTESEELVICNPLMMPFPEPLKAIFLLEEEARSPLATAPPSRCPTPPLSRRTSPVAKDDRKEVIAAEGK